MDGMDIWMVSLYFIWTLKNNVIVKNIHIHSFQERDSGRAVQSVHIAILAIDRSLQRAYADSFCEKWRIELFRKTLYQLH